MSNTTTSNLELSATRCVRDQVNEEPHTPLPITYSGNVAADAHNNYYSPHPRWLGGAAATVSNNSGSARAASLSVDPQRVVHVNCEAEVSGATGRAPPIETEEEEGAVQGLGHCPKSDVVSKQLSTILLPGGECESKWKRQFSDNWYAPEVLVNRGDAFLSEKLWFVDRESLLMIGRKNGQRARQPETVDTVAGRGEGARAVSVLIKREPVEGAVVPKWRTGEVHRAPRAKGWPLRHQANTEAILAREEEFEDDSTDPETLAAMVTGSGCGGGGIGYPEITSKATEKNAITVEGQLNALLTSASKDVLALTAGDGKGTAARRHTNLIENQLLSLEEQFWRTGRSNGNATREQVQQAGKEGGACASQVLGSTVHSVGLEATEDMALLGDQSQQTAMSDSTPVKRVVKVTVGSGSSVVLEEDSGRGGVGRLVPSPSTNLSRMKRFEQFLKSLVGKKTSSGGQQGDMGGGPVKEVQVEGGAESTSFECPTVPVRSSLDLKSEMAMNEENGEPENQFTLRRPSFGSMSSLNLAVQQKFLNILPSSGSLLSLSAAKRNLSVYNLTSIPESRSGGTAKFTKRATPACCRNGIRMRRTGRGLKTASCSFSDFDLSDGDAQVRGHEARRRNGDQLRNGELGGVEDTAFDGTDRRDSMHTWRLKVSRSANHLQSMMSATGGGPMRPLNRFRNSFLESSTSQVNLVEEAQCSRCSSILSLAGGTMGKVRCSDSSVTGESSEDAVADKEPEADSGGGRRSAVGKEVIVVTKGGPESTVQSCKLCLGEVSPQQLTGISQCRCAFCTDCMRAYIEFEILEGAYEISCPDAMCPSQGVVTMSEISALTSPDLVLKHNRYRLNREVELDKNRTWCPRAGCDTVCVVDNMNHQTSSSSAATAVINVISPSTSTSSTGGTGKNAALVAYAVLCPTCEEEFCSACKKTWHSRLSCEENMKKLAADGHTDSVGIPFDSDLIKCCPMCGVPIEKDEGCAQMMCKRCKHVFCWYCLASLDDDFLLRHYDKGPCKNKLGHSRASVVWHRAQVIGIFAGFGILLLVASPLLLLAAPCIVCCKCRICSGGPKIEEEQEIDFDDPLTLHR